MTAKTFDESSNLITAEYEPVKQELTVVFRSGGTYTYFDIPPAVSAELMAAESPGGYLAANIKGQYRYEGGGLAAAPGGIGIGGSPTTAAREAIERAAAVCAKLPDCRGRSMVLTKLDEAHLWLTRVK